MSLIGLISTPTFSNKPRMKAKKKGGREQRQRGAQKKENSEEPTWPGLRVPEKIFPEVVIVLLFCKLNGLNDDE